MANDSTTYAVADLLLQSDIQLPELSRSTESSAADSGARAEWRVRRSSARYPGTNAEWFHEWHDRDGARWLQFGYSRGRYVLRFQRWASFVVDPVRREIVCCKARTTPGSTFRHLLLNQVLPLVCGGPSRVVLHASAVSHQGGALGFVGNGGAGKSTLCAALIANGCTLLTDDAMLIEQTRHGLRVPPFYCGVRLWPDAVRVLAPALPAQVCGGRPTADHTRSDDPGARVCHYSRKQRLSPLRFSVDAVPLHALCLLTPDRDRAGTLQVTRVTPREAVISLTRSVFELDVTAAERLRATFEILSNIGSRVAVYQVRMPWQLEQVAVASAQLLHELQR